MAIITGKHNVQQVYREAQDRGWVLPCFNSENLTTTEAILSTVQEHGDEIGIPNLPIIIGITVLYDERPQAVHYTNTHRWDTGLQLFMEELQVLAGAGGPYENLQVLIHLDHIIHEKDSGLLQWDLSRFSSIMYDASKLPIEENCEVTAQFVQNYGHLLLVEGACDEIAEYGDGQSGDLTTADQVERYYRTTGVDMVVANLGTEHRASSSDLKYRGDYARQIKERIGPKLVLHGGSSVKEAEIKHLADDGICKVNIWTLLEREASTVLFEHMVRNASKVAGFAALERLRQEGYLGFAAAGSSRGPDLDYFTTAARQRLVYCTMKRIIKNYLKMWYI
ncbi:class II fructose-bisphosphate aldolase [Paenibacillus sp. GCM10027626]|uniref:class II fructose-bisphosphate aldolase n=1 Tax=Paenibacillus sp. GCM10027626 TaxID=3273411 RepID=UPI00362FBBD0